MPAIDLAHLKTQAAQLADNFSNHLTFIPRLHEILEYYTNRTMRASQVAQRHSLPTYHTPQPVLRQIMHELSPLAEKLPLKGVTLVNELWNDGTFESRLIAARLTGMLPPSDAIIPILSHLPTWLSQSTDNEIRRALLTDSFTRIRKENPEAFFLLLEEWLKSPRTSWQIWGMQALLPLLDEPGFQNLPAVFRILQPAIISASPTTQLELQACLIALERNALTETTLYLRDILTTNSSVMLIRLIRRMLPGFSAELQSSLRAILRDDPPK
jgi:hypothetical protein